MDNGELGSWGSPDVVSRYATEGFSDPGEAAAMSAIDTQARGSVLDVGVGGGRTTGLLHRTARSYVGVDISAEMLELARSRFPGVDLRVADARDLGDFDSNAFDLVVFSFNGIDALDHAGRLEAIRELSRVLAPRGRLVFSSLNRDGASCDERPWTFWRGRQPREVVLDVARKVRHPRREVRAVRNYRRTRSLAVRAADWSEVPMRSHEFRFLVHYATVGATVAMLRDVGLAVESAHDKGGRPVDPHEEHSDADYVHYVCRPV
ncbi:class I SAM-dependent methyltransferase [Nocardioides korecus]